MKNLTKKRTLNYCLFLLTTFHALHATKPVYQPRSQAKRDHTLELTKAKCKLLVRGYCRAYNIPTDVLLLVAHFVHEKPLQYKNKPLPIDLSEQNLSGSHFYRIPPYLDKFNVLYPYENYL